MLVFLEKSPVTVEIFRETDSYSICEHIYKVAVISTDHFCVQLVLVPLISRSHLQKSPVFVGLFCKRDLIFNSA